MDELSRRYEGEAHFLFVYVREAHPERFPDHPAHKSIDQKFQHARDMRERHDTPRQILVDQLDGPVHRVWGGMANMSWVLDRAGDITYKAGWTLESDIRAALDQIRRVLDLKRQGAESGRTILPYYKETMSVHLGAVEPSETAQSAASRGAAPGA